MKKSICKEIKGLGNMIARFLDKEIDGSKFNKVSCTNLWIIGFVASNSERDIYQKDIESNFSITRSTASRVIDLMEEKDLVKRETVSHDARLRKIVLTEKSREIANKMKEFDGYLNSVLCKGMSEAELDCFFTCIDKMNNNLLNYKTEA